MEEDLNIENKIRRNVLLALNKYKYARAAASALGINERTLLTYRNRFNIERCPVTREYSFKEKKKFF